MVDQVQSSKDWSARPPTVSQDSLEMSLQTRLSSSWIASHGMVPEQPALLPVESKPLTALEALAGKLTEDCSINLGNEREYH